MKIKMTNGYDIAELYREDYSKNKRLEAIGLRVYNHLTKSFVPLVGTTMPKADQEGCDFEFQRIIDKAIMAGFRLAVS